jgi:hypothetical protein
MPRPKQQGNRKRFYGFSLTDAERDRVVADWIDAQPNAAEAIKAMIYAVATGKGLTGRTEMDVLATEEGMPRSVDRTDPRVTTLVRALDT